MKKLMLLTKKGFKIFFKLHIFVLGRLSDYSKFNHLLGELIRVSTVVLMHMS